MRFLNLVLILGLILISNPSITGRCSGGANCTACSNCSSCKNCSENGGTCSVCANYNESESQPDALPIQTLENELIYSDDYSTDYEEQKNEKSSYGWVWLVVGGFIFFVLFDHQKNNMNLYRSSHFNCIDKNTNSKILIINFLIVQSNL